MWIAWRSRQLFRASIGLVFSFVTFVLFAPSSVLERLSTIGDTRESSAAARLVAWGAAMRMIADNPVLGVGLRNFQTRYEDYANLPKGQGAMTYVAHNSYLQIWAESGSIAFAIYVVLLFSTFLACRKVWRLGTRNPELAWASDYARMMEATMVGFMIGAMFLNRGHFDLVYHWLALVTCLVTIAFAASRNLATARAGHTSSGAGVVSVRTAAAMFGNGLRKPQPRWGRAH
jgi:O-antigen ligase